MEVHEFRCSKCGKLLAKVRSGDVEIKCPRCNALNTCSKPPEPKRLT